MKQSKLKLYPGCKIKFDLKHSPYLKGLGTINEIYTGEGIPCIFSVEIEEVEGHYIYQAGDSIFVFQHEIEKLVYFIWKKAWLFIITAIKSLYEQIRILLLLARCF